MAETYKKMKKTELHRHLELSLRASTIYELAPQFNIDLPDEQTFRSRFIIDSPMKDLGSVLNKFLDTQLLLDSEEILERITFEVCEDAWREGIDLIELRYAPTFIKYRHDHLTFEKIHTAIVRGKERAEKTYPMRVGLICIIQRILPVAEAERVTEFAIEHKATFVGLDLADNEEGFDSKPFAPFFYKAKKSGLGITVHAGEANLPKAPRYVREAIDHLGATRIGHGIQIYRDPSIMEYVKQNQIVLEVCPTSNWLTQAIQGGIENHPIRKLYDAGVLITVNTDDPGIFATDLVREYDLLHRHFGFTDKEFQAMDKTARKASFIRPRK